MEFAPEIIILLTLMAAILMTWATLTVYKYLMSPVLLNLANVFDAVVIAIPWHHVHPLRFAAKALRVMDQSIPHWLGQFLLAEQDGLAIIFHVLANQVHALGKLIGDLANSAEHVLTHIVTVQIPAAVARAETFTNHRVAALKATLTHDLGRLENTLTHDLSRLRQLTEAELAKFARGIDRLRTDVTRELVREADRARTAERVLTRELDRELARLRPLEKLLTEAGAFALVAVALGRMGLSWLRCPSLARLGSRIGCGGFGLLETLLSDAIEALIVSDLCRFAGLMSAEAEAIRPLMFAFVDVEEALVGCHGATAPSDLRLPRLDLPRATANLALG